MSNTNSKQEHTLDHVLAQIGNFGLYQVYVFGLLALCVMIYLPMHSTFIFTTKNPGYRCLVNNCDMTSESSNEYNPLWLQNAVPYKNNKPAKCQQFQRKNQTSGEGRNGFCGAQNFDRNSTHSCKDGYVYDTEKIYLVNDLDIHCEENTWKLTLIGTVNTLGQFVGMPLAGFVSDRYGRRATLVWGTVLAAIGIIIQTFVNDYITFLLLEFLNSTLGAGAYACSFILAVELVGPSKRVFGGAVIAYFCTFGEVYTGLLAMWLSSWRMLLFVAAVPAFLLLSYLWLIPESVRWLLSQRRYEEAKTILRRVASINKTTISEDTLDKLTIAEENSENDSIAKVFKSRTLFLRFLTCCFCWITCAFVFYGITLNSVSLSSNTYVDYILTCLVEIPAHLVTFFAINRLGRRTTQCCSYLISGISSLIFVFISLENYSLVLLISLLGKFGVSGAFSTIYIITSEVFPTPMRHSMMGVCSMIGRIGSMVSPQVPLFSQIWPALPSLLFAIMSLIAAGLALFLPETLNTKLPDTIEDAINIGKKQNKAPE